MFHLRPGVRDGGARLAWGISTALVLGCASREPALPPPPCPPPAPEALNQPAHWEAKCRLGDSESCWVVGVGYEHGGPSTWGQFARDPRRAAIFYRLGCERGHVKSCTKLASLLVEGRGVIADPGSAFLLAKDSCGRDDDEGCFLAGGILRTGLIGGQEPARASYYFIRSCDLGNPNGCTTIEEEGTHRPPRAEPPDGAAGLRLGEPLAEAQRACQGAGHAWLAPDPSAAATRSACSGTPAKLSFPARAELDTCGEGSVCELRLIRGFASEDPRVVLREYASLEERLRKRYGPPSSRTRALALDCSAAPRALVQCLSQKRATLVARWQWDGGPVVSLELAAIEDKPALVISYATPRSERERRLQGL